MYCANPRRALANKKIFPFNNSAMKNKIIITGLLWCISLHMHAATQQQIIDSEHLTKPSIYQSPVFYALIFVAVLLLIFIVQLGKVFSAIAEKYGKEQSKKTWDGFKTVILLLGLGSIHAQANAQLTMPEPHTQAMFLHEGFGHPAINGLVVIILLELSVVFYYMLLIRSFTRSHSLKPAREIRRSRFWDLMNQSVAIESEAAIMTDHEYDGIRELDNALPPWWKYGFMVSILWGAMYLIYFHVAKEGELQAAEYATEMENARISLEAYRAKAADSVDEFTIALSTDPSIIQKGAIHYDKLCKVCHGAAGEGIVGPNLTDAYWLHGGAIKDVFKTVKYGVQGKGMKSWQQELSAAEIGQVSNYVLSLQGTSPANGKAPEGDLYSTIVSEPDDTTAVRDTAKTQKP
jgi:cytochrome c oxidase cbb3-type subunit 3